MNESKETNKNEELVSQMIPKYLEYTETECGRAPITVTRYRAHLLRFITCMGDGPVDQIGREQIFLFKRRLHESGLGPASISGILSCLRGFLKYLRDVRDIRVYDAEKIKRPAIPRREVDYLSKEEVRRFLAAIPTHTFTGLRDRAFVEVLVSSGMRISEALSLDRDMIDWERQEAVVLGKGNKQRRVFFSRDAIEWLVKSMERRQDDEKAVFVTTGGEPKRMGPNGAWKKFQRYAGRAGIKRRVYPHLLRHTMATNLLENGCPIGHIRTLLGHAHLATTCRYYLGRLTDAEAKIAHSRYLSYEEAGESVNEVLP